MISKLQTAPVNMPGPVRIRSGLARSRPDDSCARPDLFGQNWTVTQSARTKSDPACFAQHDLGCQWKNTTKSKNGKLDAGLLRSAQNWAQWFLMMRWAKTWPSHPDQIWVSFTQYGPGLLWKNGTESDAGSRIHYIHSCLILAARWP